MKLQSKKKKIVTIAIIAVVAVLLIVGIVLGVLLLGGGGSTNTPPADTETSIKISALPKTEYYVGDSFNPVGLKIEVKENGNLYYIDHTNPGLTLSGFDSSVANDNLVITATFKEMTLTFSVKIKEIQPPPTEVVLESISLTDNFKTTYSLKLWNTTGPDFAGVYLVLHFSDGTTEQIPGVRQYCQNLVFSFDEACTFDLIVKYSYAGETYTCTVPITITE